jgi:DNA-binding response OmpR family regulator
MKILIVEDEHKIANLIKQGLEQEKMVVDLAYDGTSGYDLASMEDYDLIILDRMLPGLDGLMICKKLREKGNHTPVLILTAKGQTMDKVEGLDSGADDYLTKPFAFEELLARIRALTRRPKQTISQKLQVEDLILNLSSYEVIRGAEKIKLSSKEFSLLEYLIKHKNSIVTKEQIISHVWSYEANILPNTVEVFIGYLRNKIDRPFKNKDNLIHTVRGFGYKLGKN